MKLGYRFVIVFGIILMVAATGFAYNVWSLMSVRRNLVSIYESRLIGIDLLIEADRDAYQASLGLSRWMLALASRENGAADAVAIQENQAQVLERFDGFVTARQAGVKYADNADEVRANIAQFREQYPEWTAESARLQQRIRAGQFQPALALYSGEYRDKFEAMRTTLDLLTVQSLEEARDEYDQSLASMNAQLLTAGITGGTIVLLSIIMAWVLTRSITRPVYTAVDITNELAGGMMDTAIPEHRGDEFADLFQSLRNFTERVGRVIREVKETAANLAVSAEEMTTAAARFSDSSQNQASSTEQISATIEEISAGQENVAASAGDQVALIDSLSRRIDELSRLIDQMSEQLSSHMSLAREVLELAQTGKDSLQGMTEGMRSINSSSDEVTEIVGIISGISEQINLLALNAAIEAARAGEAGRGFAVVADEIGRLADKTASSIKNINSLIKANSDEITAGLANVEGSVNVVGRIIQGVDQIGNMLFELDAHMKSQLDANTEVNREAGHVRERADEIKNASTEQKAAVQEIVQSISTITETTTTVAAGAEEMAAAAQDVATMAENLNKRVNFFKT